MLHLFISITSAFHLSGFVHYNFIILLFSIFESCCYYYCCKSSTQLQLIHFSRLSFCCNWRANFCIDSHPELTQNKIITNRFFISISFYSILFLETGEIGVSFYCWSSKLEYTWEKLAVVMWRNKSVWDSSDKMPGEIQLLFVIRCNVSTHYLFAQQFVCQFLL